MRSNWRRAKLGAITEITSSKRIKMTDYVKKGIPFFRSKEIIEKYKGNSISTELFISEDKFLEIKKKFGAPEKGQILLTSVGTLGIPYQVKEGDTFYFKDGNLTWFKNFDESIDPEFLYYWLTSPVAKRKFDEITIGSTQKALTIASLKGIEIDLPPIDMQRYFVKIVKALDQKLFNNRSANQTLEAMAQAIFKSWFVDFDPVKTKIQGKQPEGMDADTAALFPDKLVESELGLIPEGWEASLMGEHFNITMGQSPKGETYNERGEGIAFFQGRRDFGFRYPSVRVYTTDPKRFAKSGDTLISVRAPVGDKNMAAIDCCIGRGIAAIRHKSNSRSFTYAFMNHVEKNLDDSGSSGTVFSSINQKELKKVSFVAPPQELIEAFHKTVDPIDQNVEALSGEIESLSLLRDTLLPKLLSGELPLEQTEKLAEVS